MVDPQTANIGLFQPTRGSDTGVWDTPVNSNTGVIDTMIGGIATIGLNNSNVTLASGQYQCRAIVFNSTLTGSVNITFPTSFMASYEIQNLCSGTSANTITLKTTVAGSQAVCCPPGEIFEVRNDGTNIKYKNFGRVGSYWDHAGSSVPAWVSGCTVPPYLYCNGATFSSATYPALTVVIGGTTLPDSRGRGRFSINDGTGRIQSSNSMNGNALFNGGGDDKTQDHSHNNSLSDPGHSHKYTYFAAASAGQAGAGNSLTNSASGVTETKFTGISITNGFANQTYVQGNSGNMPPAYMGGITLIRAA